MADEYGISQEVSRIPGPKPRYPSGKLGYPRGGVKVVEVPNDPAKYYVRFPDGGFVSAFHDGKINGDYVDAEVGLLVDSRGRYHITGLQSDQASAYIQLYGTGILVPRHSHVAADITDLSDVAVTHTALAGTGIIIKTGLTTYAVAKINAGAATDPSITNDSSEGYIAGYSWWLNASSGVIFDLIDAALGAAVWQARGSANLTVDDGVDFVANVSQISFDPTFFDVTDLGGGQLGLTLTALGTISVTDGTVTVNPLISLEFDGNEFELTDLGGGAGKIERKSTTAILVFGMDGTLSVVSGPERIYNEYGVTKTITRVSIAVNTAPTGAAIIVDVNNNGTTIFTTQSHRPQISTSGNYGFTTTIDVPSWGAGDYLTFDVDQVGSGVRGANLTVHIAFT